ncbi:unnamed protein product [Clavelina lepadiformis]|uniref:Uncharacterized protein n=1 Tax=Clavelina lepadiformis TaxID=159417 RepID=A0ABP0FM50_CLALP
MDPWLRNFAFKNGLHEAFIKGIEAVATVTVHDLPSSIQEVGTNISPFSLKDRILLERYFGTAMEQFLEEVNSGLL